MSVIQFFRILWARRLILIVSVLVCVMAALIIGKLSAPRYKANSRVMMDVVKPDPVTGEMIASSFARAYVKTQIELIRDYRIAGRAADSLGWTTSPILAAQYRARPVKDTRDFRRWLAQKIIDSTEAQLIEGSNILEISNISSNPATAAKMADAVRRAYVDQAVAFKREDAAENAQWFKKQAERIKDQLTEAERRKTDFERANNIILDADNVDQDSKRLSALASSSPAPTSGPVVIPGVANPMAEQLARADMAIANATRILGPNHPDLVNLRQQRAAIAAAQPRGSGGTVVSSGPSLGALYNAQQAKVLSLRGKADEARQLAADVSVLRDQYQKTAARAAELQQQGEANNSGLTLLGSATSPQRPSFPNWPLLIFGSLGLGIAVGVLASLLVELFSRRVRGIEDLAFDDVPVFGMMAKPRVATPFRERLFGRSRYRGKAGTA